MRDVEVRLMQSKALPRHQACAPDLSLAPGLANSTKTATTNAETNQKMLLCIGTVFQMALPLFLVPTLGHELGVPAPG